MTEMNFIDICLVADTKEDMIAALPWSRYTDEGGDERWRTAGPGFELNIIGALMLSQPVFDADGNEIIPAVVDGRYHANLRTFDGFSETIDPAIICSPTNPRRKFAG